MGITEIRIKKTFKLDPTDIELSVDQLGELIADHVGDCNYMTFYIFNKKYENIILCSSDFYDILDEILILLKYQNQIDFEIEFLQ